MSGALLAVCAFGGLMIAGPLALLLCRGWADNPPAVLAKAPRIVAAAWLLVTVPFAAWLGYSLLMTGKPYLFIVGVAILFGSWGAIMDVYSGIRSWETLPGSEGAK